MCDCTPKDNNIIQEATLLCEAINVARPNHMPYIESYLNISYRIIPPYVLFNFIQVYLLYILVSLCSRCVPIFIRI